MKQIDDTASRNREATKSLSKKSLPSQETKQEFKQAIKQPTPAIATPLPSNQQSIHRPELNQSSYAQRYDPTNPATRKLQPAHQLESKPAIATPVSTTRQQSIDMS